jgi:hypothetical protein
MNVNKLAVGAAVLAVVAVGVVAFESSGNNNVMQVSIHDSPIDVGGGSVYGSVGLLNFNTWTEIRTPYLYGSRSTNSDYIKLTGFTDPQNPNTPPGTFQGTGGWLINVNTKMSDGKTQNPKTIAFCTNLTPSAPYHCAGNSLGSDRVVYVEITSSTARWDWSFYWLKHRILFEDNQSGCRGTESLCDQIDSITITTASPLNTLGPYICTDNTKCLIEAGQ